MILRRLAPWLLSGTVMAAACVCTYWPIFADPSQMRWIGIGDAHDEAGPASYYLDYCIHHGELPLWDPLRFCGTPYAAHPLRFMFYPPQLFRSLLTFAPTPIKTHIGIAVMLAFHLLVAGVATFFFARNRGQSHAGSLVAMLVFVFSCSFVYRSVGHWLFCCMLAWLPVLLLVMTKGLEARSLRRRAVWGTIGGLCLGLFMLCGVPQIVMLMGFTLGIYYLLYLGTHFTRGGFENPGPLRYRIASHLLFLGILFGGAVLVSAVQFLPASEFAQYSARLKGVSASLFRRDPEPVPWTLLQFLATYSGSPDFEGLRFAGTGALILAAGALMHPRRREWLLFGLLFYVLLDCSLGLPFPCAALLYKLAPFEMSHPARAVIFACFPLGLLAGFGVDAVAMPLRHGWARVLRSVWLMAVGAVFLSALHSCISPHPFLDVTRAVLVVPLLLLGVALLAGWLPGGGVWRALLVCLVFGETLAWNVHMVPSFFRPKSDQIPTPDYFAGGNEFWADNYRGAGKYLNWDVYKLRAIMNGADPLYLDPVRQVLCAPQSEQTYKRQVDGVEVTWVNERGNLFLKRSFWLAQQYVRGPLPPKSVLFPSATTVFLPDPPPDLPVPEVHLGDLPSSGISRDCTKAPLTLPPESNYGEDGKYPTEFLVHLPQWDLPHKQTALCVHYISDDAWAWVDPMLADPTTGRLELGKIFHLTPTQGREIAQQIVLPDYARLDAAFRVRYEHPQGKIHFREAYLLCDNADEDEHIEILSRTANSVEVRVRELPGPRILTFVDAQYPGWHAYIDEQPAPIFLANDVFKAVALSPGSHNVRFEFRPWRVYAGMGVSVSAILLGVLFLLKERYRTIPRDPGA